MRPSRNPPMPRSLFSVAVAAMRPGQSFDFARTPNNVRVTANRYIGPGCYSTHVQPGGVVRLTRKR